MITRIALAAAAAAIVTALAGCAGGTGYGSGSGYGIPSAAPGGSSAPAPSSDLAVASTSLGRVVVDGAGLTVYVFDHDRAGRPSTCTGECARLWPAVVTTSATPSAPGVTGRIGTVATADGRKQVTLDGLPLYTYAQDRAAGDVGGQGLDGVWWTVGADGAKVTRTTGGGY
jgi:predicted lipoprotein with Yx(FWY)xxD motif